MIRFPCRRSVCVAGYHRISAKFQSSCYKLRAIKSYFVITFVMQGCYLHNCVNKSILESDWFSAALFITQFDWWSIRTVQFDLSKWELLLIKQFKSNTLIHASNSKPRKSPMSKFSAFSLTHLIFLKIYLFFYGSCKLLCNKTVYFIIHILSFSFFVIDTINW